MVLSMSNGVCDFVPCQLPTQSRDMAADPLTSPNDIELVKEDDGFMPLESENDTQPAMSVLTRNPAKEKTPIPMLF